MRDIYKHLLSLVRSIERRLVTNALRQAAPISAHRRLILGIALALMIIPFASNPAFADTCNANGATVNCVSAEVGPSQFEYVYYLSEGYHHQWWPTEGAAYSTLVSDIKAQWKPCTLYMSDKPWDTILPDGMLWNEGQIDYEVKYFPVSMITSIVPPWPGGPTCDHSWSTNNSFGLVMERSVQCPAGTSGYGAEGGFCIVPPSTSPVVFPEKNLGYCTQCAKSDPSIDAGNPINTAIGNKIQTETDYVGAGPFPVEFKRYYNGASSGYGPALYVATEHLGPGWRNTYDRRISFGDAGPPYTAYAYRPDGKVNFFSLENGQFISDPDVTDTLTKLADASGNFSGWKYKTDDDSVELYDTTGRLISITNRTGLTQTLTYDPDSGLLVKVTDPFGRSLTFTYDASGKMTAMTDPAGGKYSFQYDSSNSLIKVTYPGNTTRGYSYGNGYELTGIIDEDGNQFASWSYDAWKRAVSSQHAGGAERVTLDYNSDGSTTVTDALNATKLITFTTINGVKRPTGTRTTCGGCPTLTTAITYDSRGFVTSRTDANGNVTEYQYDSRGLETSRTEAYGTSQARTILTTWDPNFRLPTQIVEPGRTIAFIYDTSGNLTQKTITAGSLTRTWKYTYTPQGLLASVDGPRIDVSDVTTYGYDCNGNLTSITNPLNQVTQITAYDANGRPLTIQDPNGLVTTLAYDPRGRITSRSVGGETTSYDYDKAGNLTQITQPDASYLAFTYDAAHRLTRITDSQGNYISYTLDAMGNHTKTDVYDPSGVLVQTRSKIFSALNRLYQQVGAQGQTTTYSYDNDGKVTGVTDPLGNSTHYAFDALNHLVTLTDPNNGVSSFAYDADDQLTQVTDPRNLQTHYSVDALGNLNQIQNPDTGNTALTYDSAGNVVTRTDARGKQAAYTYDALNRVTQIAYGDSTVTFQYDSGANAIGHLSQMTDASGNTQWSYDQHGRVIHKQQTAAYGTVIKSISYAYDDQGHLSSVTYPSGSVIGYTYSDGHVSSVTLNGSPLLSNIQYQPFNAAKSWTWGNGAVQTRTFDADGRLSSFDVGSNIRAVGYDKAGRITSLNDGSPATTQTMAYDNLDRLTSYVLNASNLGYSYDADGNRTGLTIGASNYTYSYPTTSNQMGAVSGPTAQTYGYDAAGNLVSDSTNSYVYDNSGRLTSVMSGKSTLASYQFNGLGQRVYKRTGKGGAVHSTKQLAHGGIKHLIRGATVFMYDEQGHLIGEYDASNGNPVEETVYLGDMPVAVLKPGSSAIAPAVYFVDADQLDTPRAIKDASNTTVWTWDGDPFGNVAPNQDPANTGSTFVYNLRFPGQYADQETGRNYNYFRDYDPQLGRYIESDPIGLKGGVNTYSYVKADPTQLRDPQGTDPFIGATVGLVAGTIQGYMGAVAQNGSTSDQIWGAVIGGVTGLGIGALDPSLGVGTLAIIGATAAGAGDIIGQEISIQTSKRKDPCKEINWGSTVGAIAAGGFAGYTGVILSPLAEVMGEWTATTFANIVSTAPAITWPAIGADAANHK